MSHTEQVGLPLEESLRGHVLGPLETSESVLDQGYEEVDAERRAFEEFRGRVAGIETIANASAIPATRPSLAENRSRGPERVRSAFHETVMGVDHPF
jgi:hypothetical protein